MVSCREQGQTPGSDLPGWGGLFAFPGSVATAHYHVDCSNYRLLPDAEPLPPLEDSGYTILNLFYGTAVQGKKSRKMFLEKQD